MKRAIGIVAGSMLAVSGCQAYDAVPVQPNAIEVQDNTQTIIGHPLAPNIMLVVDKSGSMTDSADGNTPGACQNGGGAYSGRGASCKWNDLLDTLLGPTSAPGTGFLSQLDKAFATNAAAMDPVPLGLAAFPGSAMNGDSAVQASCEAGVVFDQILPMNDSAITTTLTTNLAPGGGTPTAATMANVGSSFPAQSGSAQRSNYVILMTDGAPNCDSNFSANVSNCTNDRCTLDTPTQTCPASTWATAACPCDTDQGAVIPEGCLDEEAAVTAVANLYSNGIKTFVIGFGVASVSPSSTETLEKMGAAGQGSTSFSASSYYQANSQTDLQAALTAILGIIGNPGCQYNLEQSPPSQQLIEVLVTPSGGTTSTLTQSQFTYNMTSTPPSITITDMTVCNAILSSTPNNPYGLEIKYLTTE